MKTESVMHVKGRSRRFSSQCGCEIAHKHGSPVLAAYFPCGDHWKAGIGELRLTGAATSSAITSMQPKCNCSLQYRGSEGTSFIPCERHRGDYFAVLHNLGLLSKEETKA